MKDIVRQVVNVLATLLVIAINILANALPLNGLNTGAISDRFKIYFVPAGYAFSIWGVIYLVLIGFAIYQALPRQRQNPYLRRIGYLYALSCLANVAWLFLWHYEFFELTLVAMIALLFLLIAIYLRLATGRTRVSTAETWLVRVPFSLYLGWITVATIANVAQLLYYLNWSGWGINPEVWAAIMLVAGAAIASAVGISRADVAYALVIVWAFAGIIVEHSATPIVATTAGLMVAVAALTLLLGLLLKRGRVQAATRSPGTGIRDRW
jgi:hypothetical protein